MPLKPTNSDDALQLNLTPMIDVVFLLVIFFMAATQFADAERAIDLDLPDVASAGTNLAIPNEPMIVSVNQSGTLALDGKQVTIEELTEDLRLAAQDRPDLEVQVHGDSGVVFQEVAGALAACRAAGVTDIGITVEVAASGTPLTK